jgi:hypothetical protein
MYFLMELLIAVCSVAFVAAILFMVCAAVILLKAGIRNVLRLSSEYVLQVASIPTTAQTGRKIEALDQFGSLIAHEPKLANTRKRGAPVVVQRGSMVSNDDGPTPATDCSRGLSSKRWGLRTDSQALLAIHTRGRRVAIQFGLMK